MSHCCHLINIWTLKLHCRCFRRISTPTINLKEKKRVWWNFINNHLVWSLEKRDLKLICEHPLSELYLYSQTLWGLYCWHVHSKSVSFSNKASFEPPGRTAVFSPYWYNSQHWGLKFAIILVTCSRNPNFAKKKKKRVFFLVLGKIWVSERSLQDASHIAISRGQVSCG